MTDESESTTRGSVFRWIIIIIAIAAAVGVLYVALGVFGVAIPAWVVKVFWILVAAVACIAAVKFIASMIGSKP